MTATERHAADRDALAREGLSGDALDALSAYTAHTFDTDGFKPAQWPLADAPHIEAWEVYARDAKAEGVIPALSRRLVQLRFPIEQGISQSDAYLRATKRGVAPPAGAPALVLEAAERVELVLHDTLAGRIPVIVCASRADFVSLVRACSCRNEPETVPASMGACIVSGLNNWDRVARWRQQLETERGAPMDETEWTAAFRELIPRKALYQDRLIILSREPYSAVPASALGLDEAEWLNRSVEIRREHECTHYFTLVAFGLMRNNLLDEVIADFAALARIYGRYDAQLALRFLGLEAHPTYRVGGRFENYLDGLTHSLDAVRVLQDIIVRAARAIEAFSRNMDLTSSSNRHRMVLALCGSTLVELASERAAGMLQARMDAAIFPSSSLA